VEAVLGECDGGQAPDAVLLLDVKPEPVRKLTRKILIHIGDNECLTIKCHWFQQVSLLVAKASGVKCYDFKYIFAEKVEEDLPF
jgi:hypothetical protein